MASKTQIKPKGSFAGLPQTTRANAFVLGPDPKGKNFLYCCANNVIIRDIETPKNHDEFSGHQKPPVSAKYSKSGFYICSGDKAGNVKIWDTTQAEHLVKYEYQVLRGAIRDIAWDNDSKRIAVCGEGNEKFAHAFLWDSGSSVGTLDGMSKSCNSIDLKPTRPYRCAVASEDYSTSFYEGPPFKRVIKELEGGNNFANCVRFSPDGKYFAVGNSNKNVYLFDGKTADLVGVIGEEPTHQGGVYSLCFSPDSQELLTVSADKTAKIWNVESRQLETNFVMGTSVEDQQLGCLWQDDHIITVSLSGELKYLDRTNPDTPLKVIRGHNKAIVWVATDRKEAIFSGSFEGRILKWNASTGEAIQFKGRGHNTKVTCALYDANSNCLITAGLDDNVRFTDCDTCEYNNESAVPLESQPSAMAMTSDGGIVVACQNELVLIKDGRKVSSLPWKAHFPAKIAVFGSTIISTGATTNTFKLYNIENNTITATTDKFSTNKAIYAFAVSPDLSKVAVADFSSILVYNLCDNSFKDPEKSFHGHSSNISAMGWSPDGQHLCSVSMDQQLIVWDYASESKKTKRAYFKSVITDCTWLDDNTVVTVADDCAVKQWSISF